MHMQVLCGKKSGKWGLQASGVRRSDRTVDLELCCSTNELQAKLVALVTQTAQASPTRVPVGTQNKAPAMSANQGAAPAAKAI